MAALTLQERKTAYMQNLNQLLDQMAAMHGLRLSVTTQARQLGEVTQVEAVFVIQEVQGWQPPVDNQKSETAITKTDG